MTARKFLLSTVAAAAFAVGGLTLAAAGLAPAALAAEGQAPIADIVRAPSDMPAPLARRQPATVQVKPETMELAALTSAPLTDVQAIAVPPGGAGVVDIQLEVPGGYIIVDHALSRVAHGLVGRLIVEGPERPDLFREGLPPKVAGLID